MIWSFVVVIISPRSANDFQASRGTLKYGSNDCFIVVDGNDFLPYSYFDETKDMIIKDIDFGKGEIIFHLK